MFKVIDFISRCKKIFKRDEFLKKSNNKIRFKVGYFVIIDSVFPLRSLFEMMGQDPIFDCYIVVIPDILRGAGNMHSCLKDSVQRLSLDYPGRVISSYNQEKKEFIDLAKKFDIICFSNPYDEITHEYYKISYVQKLNIITFYANYAYFMIKYTEGLLERNKKFYSKLSLFLVDSPLNLEACKAAGYDMSKCLIAGYLKLEKILRPQNLIQFKKTKKRVIIAPHHTFDTPIFNTSNFLRYADFFIDLLETYPQIDFVFRPHPLLEVVLSKEDLWGKQKTNEYFNKLKSYKNLIYSQGGDYIDIFIGSDAIIHDCISFIIEYLFTEKPALFMVKNKPDLENIFTQDAKDCLSCYYKGYEKEDILDFINNVVIQEVDPMQNYRKKYVEDKSYLVINSTERLLKTIKSRLKA